MNNENEKLALFECKKCGARVLDTVRDRSIKKIFCPVCGITCEFKLIKLLNKKRKI